MSRIESDAKRIFASAVRSAMKGLGVSQTIVQSGPEMLVIKSVSAACFDQSIETEQRGMSIEVQPTVNSHKRLFEIHVVGGCLTPAAPTSWPCLSFGK